jgi:hypothetical protein
MMETRQKRGLAAVGRFLVGGDMARQSRKEYPQHPGVKRGRAT